MTLAMIGNANGIVMEMAREVLTIRAIKAQMATFRAIRFST